MYPHELTDPQWKALEPLLPPNGPKRGRPWRDHRTILNAILYILRTGAPWRYLPREYGPWQTAFGRFRRWVRDGTWDRLVEALQIRLDRAGQIDWDLWCVDGSNVRAHRDAAGGGKKGGPKSPTTTPWAARAGASARSSTC
jgi:transposase